MFGLGLRFGLRGCGHGRRFLDLAEQFAPLVGIAECEVDLLLRFGSRFRNRFRLGFGFRRRGSFNGVKIEVVGQARVVIETQFLSDGRLRVFEDLGRVDRHLVGLEQLAGLDLVRCPGQELVDRRW